MNSIRILLAIMLLASLFVTCVGHASATVQVTDVKIMVMVTYDIQPAPAAGLLVKLFLQGQSLPSDWGYTNADGNYEFTVSLDTSYNITVSDDLGNVMGKSVSVPPVIYYEFPSYTYYEDFSFPYQTPIWGAPVAVRVTALDFETHVPVPGVIVNSRWNLTHNNDLYYNGAQGTTDAFGNVTFQNVTNGASDGDISFVSPASPHYIESCTATITITTQAVPQTIYATLLLVHGAGQEPAKTPKPLCSFALMISASILCSILVVGRKLKR